jgi:hypothetical protein
MVVAVKMLYEMAKAVAKWWDQAPTGCVKRHRTPFRVRDPPIDLLGCIHICITLSLIRKSFYLSFFWLQGES